MLQLVHNVKMTVELAAQAVLMVSYTTDLVEK